MAVETQAPPISAPTNLADLRRKDIWWVDPLVFFVLFSAFAVWATFRAFQNGYYYDPSGNLLSPLYSPTILLAAGGHSSTQIDLSGLGIHLFGFAISPALLILPFPLSFRLSCYYYRKAIYRSYLADPAGCAVPEPRFLWLARFKKYMGERAFPFVVQNFHRYAFYAAAIFIVILWKDTVDTFVVEGPAGGHAFHVSVGSLVFLANISLLTLYTFSCHSWRHLIGGCADCYSCSALARTRYGLWSRISFLNERHGRWAMMSLVSVGLTDVYVYLVTTHAITNIRLF